MIINYSDYKKIQEMKSKGFNTRQTYLKLGYTNYITYKLWNMTEEEFLKMHNLKHERIDIYKDFILEELKLYTDIHNSTILDHIKDKFNITKFNFSLAAYYRYMNALRKEYGYKTTEYRKFRMEQNKKPGEEAQVDMGEYILKDDKSNKYKVYFFAMVLSFSREKYVYFSSTKFNARLFIYAHDNAFRYFGGRVKVIRYDQDKVNVISENMGNVVYVKEFEKYLQDVGFNVYLCKGHDPDTKGKIENVIRYIKTSFLDNRIYYGIDNLNYECIKWLDRTGNGSVSLATFKVPREVFLKDEAKHLIPYTHERISLTNQRVVRVNNLSDIEYKCNFYMLPLGKYETGERVKVEEVDGELLIFDFDTNKLIVSHKILKGKGNRSVIEIKYKLPKIYEELLEEFKKVPCVKKFLKNMASSYPRYVTEQCRLLKKIFVYYNRDDVIEIIRKCNLEDKASVSDIISYLVVKEGIDKIKPILPTRSSKYYEHEASILSKYQILVDGIKNE